MFSLQYMTLLLSLCQISDSMLPITLIDCLVWKAAYEGKKKKEEERKNKRATLGFSYGLLAATFMKFSVINVC